MATEAMERVQAHIELQADKARASIAYRAAFAAVESDSRHARALRSHRARAALFECGQRLRQQARFAAENYAGALLREIEADFDRRSRKPLRIVFTSGAHSPLSPNNERRFMAVEVSECERIPAHDAAKLRAVITRAGDWRNQDEPPSLFLMMLASVALALTLGWLGPAIDAQPDRRAEWLLAEELLHAPGTLATWEAEARTACANVGGDNGAYVRLASGAIYCTDKRGRRLQKAAL